MRGDIQEAILLFCANARTLWQIRQKFGNPPIMSLCHRGMMETKANHQVDGSFKKVYQTTPKGAEWVYSHRAKKAVANGN